MKKTILNLALIGSLAAASNVALADSDDSARSSCKGLPDHGSLKSALVGALAEGHGFNLESWATIVNRDGVVCAVAFSGADRGSQWPGSRAISAQKANTANAFSLPGLALSTANLYTATQPGGSLFGLQFSNPVNTDAAYKGPSKNYGQPNDPLVGLKIGGVNVFGGGLALYNSSGEIVGAIGVSGDSSCADHNRAWYIRSSLNLDYVPSKISVSGDNTRPDNIVYDITSPATQMNGVSASGWGHPDCGHGESGISLPQVK